MSWLQTPMDALRDLWEGDLGHEGTNRPTDAGAQAGNAADRVGNAGDRVVETGQAAAAGAATGAEDRVRNAGDRVVEEGKARVPGLPELPSWGTLLAIGGVVAGALGAAASVVTLRRRR